MSKRSRHRRGRQGRSTANPPAPPVELQLQVERVVGGGHGLARDDKGVVLIEGAAVGDVVTCAVRKKRGVRWGQILSVDTDGEGRVTPTCPAAGTCGGCDFLHLSEAAQHDAKRSMVMDALRRGARVDPDVVEKVVLPVCAPRRRQRVRVRVRAGVDGKLGFYARGAHTVVPLTSTCEVLDERLLEVIPKLRVPHAEVELAVGKDGGVKAAAHERAREALVYAVDVGLLDGLVLLDDDGEVAEVLGDALLHGLVAEDVLDAKLQADAHTFAQATAGGGRAIANAVVHGAFVDDDGPSDDELQAPLDLQRWTNVADDVDVLELFAGAGHLTFSLAASGAEVTAVEGLGHGLHWLHENADIAAEHDLIATTAQLYIDGQEADAFAQLLQDVELGVDDVDVMVVDPPRTGIPDLGGLLQVCAPKRLVMVSCDPATGARDVRAAREAGYVVDWVVPIDAFPQTHHVEWVARLTLPTTPP